MKKNLFSISGNGCDAVLENPFTASGLLARIECQLLEKRSDNRLKPKIKTVLKNLLSEL